STGTKSTVPAMVVRNASVANLVMRLIPDWPVVSFCQLSALPMPSEVTTPMPVTATGGPACWREDAISALLSVHRFDQGHAFAAPMADRRHHDLRQRSRHDLFDARGIARRKQLVVPERECCKSN